MFLLYLIYKAAADSGHRRPGDVESPSYRDRFGPAIILAPAGGAPISQRLAIKTRHGHPEPAQPQRGPGPDQASPRPAPHRNATAWPAPSPVGKPAMGTGLCGSRASRGMADLAISTGAVRVAYLARCARCIVIRSRTSIAVHWKSDSVSGYRHETHAVETCR
jgi:hypothetical protein